MPLSLSYGSYVSKTISKLFGLAGSIAIIRKPGKSPFERKPTELLKRLFQEKKCSTLLTRPHPGSGHLIISPINSIRSNS